MDRKRKNHKRYCIALGCHNNTKALPNLSLFKLPKDRQTMREWLRILGREDLLHREDLKHSSYEVCCFHFDESSMKVMKVLKPGAKPRPLVAAAPAREDSTRRPASPAALQPERSEQSTQTGALLPHTKQKLTQT